MKIPMPKEKKHIRPIDEVRYGEPNFKQGLSVPEIVIKYGNLSSKFKTIPCSAKYLTGALSELSKAVKSIKRNPYSGNKLVTPEFIAELENYAKSLGISEIGYTKIAEHQMFKDSIVLFQNALVFTMEMKKSEIDQAPSKNTFIEIFRTYYELGKAVNLIADFLRSHGYNAQPLSAISENLNFTLMARDAGLGEFGKHGLLITKEFGPSIRLAAVLTDIENLPITHHSEHQWIRNYCDSCNLCVKGCPADAIYEKPKVFDNGSVQHIDYKKCAMPFSRDFGCTLCIKNCIFYKSSYDKISSAYQKKNN